MPTSSENFLKTSTISALMLGHPLSVEGRALIPVVDVYATVLPELHAGWFASSPKAVVVVDRERAMALPITGEPVSLTQLLDAIPDLAARIEAVREDLGT